MARNYANVFTAIWTRDGDFVRRSALAQRLYLLLVTQPEISAVGMLPLRVRRWSALAPDMSESALILSLKELEEHRFVFVDEDTEELLVRSFTRHDGGYGNPRRLPSIRDAADEIESPKLLRILAGEFDRLDLPDMWRGKAKRQVNSHSDSHSDSQSIGKDVSMEWLTDSRRVVGSTATHNPQPTTHNPSTTSTAATRGETTTKTPTFDREFAEFWDAYPNKSSKPAAVKAWAKAIKGGADPRALIDGAARYRDDPNRDAGFTAYPATWLNNERWNDPPLAPRGRASPAKASHEPYRDPDDMSIYEEPL